MKYVQKKELNHFLWHKAVAPIVDLKTCAAVTDEDESFAVEIFRDVSLLAFDCLHTLSIRPYTAETVVKLYSCGRAAQSVGLPRLTRTGLKASSLLSMYCDLHDEPSPLHINDCRTVGLQTDVLLLITTRTLAVLKQECEQAAQQTFSEGRIDESQREPKDVGSLLSLQIADDSSSIDVEGITVEDVRSLAHHHIPRLASCVDFTAFIDALDSDSRATLTALVNAGIQMFCNRLSFDLLSLLCLIGDEALSPSLASKWMPADMVEYLRSSQQTYGETLLGIPSYSFLFLSK